MPHRPPRTLYLNRELSWLAFNARVLHEASDPRVPLLERLKFLAIFSSNLDEFFMVRVGGLRRHLASGVSHPLADGMTPAEQLAAIRAQVSLLLEERRSALGTLLRELEPRGVRLVGMDELTVAEQQAIDERFESQIFPVLTPLAVDPGHPFPYVSNLSLSLAVEVRDPEHGSMHFARVKVPQRLSRWIAIPGRPFQFVPIEQVIGANLEALFPGMEIVGWHAFRVVRYSDLEFTNLEDPDDLLATIEERVFERRFGEVIRLEVQDDMPVHLRTLLLEELRDADVGVRGTLQREDIDEAGHLLHMSDLLELSLLDLPELRDPPFTPNIPVELRDHDRSIFDVIRERDLLVHHPFDSFPATVERFLQSAALDENVLAIKLTLYRTSGDTAIVRALTEAAERGKQVAVLIELKARFDEVNNISWARTLEDYGVHVAYGPTLLKTHTKIAMVVRREADGSIRRYVHIGSGNYNSRTARLYTDVGLFTCSPSIGADVSDLFNSLTGISRQRLYRKLLVAPANMRDRFIELIDRERAHARAGRGGRIVGKMNALVDVEAIEALYRASEAGVDIDLIVRGIQSADPM
jgi:polyphosphate kinase